MTDKQITLDLIADVASPTEIVFEDGETSTQWLAPYDLRLTRLSFVRVTVCSSIRKALFVISTRRMMKSCTATFW